MDWILSLEEARILGCLVEKEVTTPEYYPMTINALVAACNQKSNRDPVMQFDTGTVEEILQTLQYDKHFVTLVREAGARVPKYRQILTEVIRVGPAERAVLCELMLRGPQTQGELRTRAGRMQAMESLAEVEQALRELMDWGGEALVCKLGPRRGGRESRFAHLLCGEIKEETVPDQVAAVRRAAAPLPREAADRLEAVERQLAELKTVVEGLREQLDQFRAQFE